MIFNMLIISEGIYYFVRSIICFFLLETWFATERKRWIAIGVSILVGLNHSYNICATTLLFSNIELALDILVIMLVSIYYFHTKKIEIISLVWFYHVVIQILEFLLVTVLSLRENNAYTQYDLNRIIFLLAFTVFLSVNFFTLRRLFQKMRRIELHAGIIIIVDTLYSILIIFFQRVYLEPISNYILRAWMLLGIYTVLIVSVCVLFEYWRYDHQKYIMAQQKNETLEQNYQDIMRVYKENARLFHDFNAHMNVIKQYLSKGDNLRCLHYVDEMTDLGETPKENKWTGNEIIDLIINCKKRKAEEEKIILEVSADTISGMSIPEIDLCAIFSNLLDNAIENCNKKDGKIDIHIKIRNELLILIIKNPVIDNYVQHSRRFLTTKKDKLKHGIGIDSVQYAVDRNNGSFEYGIHDNYFEAIVTLSL